MSEKEKEYKVDSTKGQSLINPINFKGDALVQVWMDSRVLATLCRWLEQTGTNPRFLSQVVRRPLEILAAHVVDNEGVEMVEDTITAVEMIERRFQVSLGRGGKGGKNRMHNVVLSNARKGELERLGQEVVRESKEDRDLRKKLEYQRGVYEERQGLVKKGKYEDEIEQAMKRAKEEEEKETRESIEKDLERARESGMLVDDTTKVERVGGLREGMSEGELEEYRRKQEEESIRLENQPIDWSQVKSAGREDA